MKEGGEVWLCDLSSFTARCFILKPLIYRFSPSAAVQVIGTGGGAEGVWRGTDCAKDCQPNCLSPSEPPIMGASQSRVVTRAAGGSAGVSSQLLHRFADLTLRLLPNSNSSSRSNEPGEERGGKNCSQSGASNSRVVPASSLLHCYSLLLWRVGDSLWYNKRSKWFRWTVATSWQLSLLFFVFFSKGF